MIFIPFFWVCWKVKHKDRFTAVIARAIYFLHKSKKK